MGTYAGIDLHSSNSYIGIIDEQDRRQFGKRLPNSLTQILLALEPFKKNLEAVVVESTMLIRLAHTERRGSLPSCTTDSGAAFGRTQIKW